MAGSGSILAAFADLGSPRQTKAQVGAILASTASDRHGRCVMCAQILRHAPVGTACQTHVKRMSNARQTHVKRMRSKPGTRTAGCAASALSGHDKQQDQPEQHHDQSADTNVMRRPFRYFTERVAPCGRKNEGKHPLNNQHQCDREKYRAGYVHANEGAAMRMPRRFGYQCLREFAGASGASPPVGLRMKRKNSLFESITTTSPGLNVFRYACML
jgi:hypothetical protein